MDQGRMAACRDPNGAGFDVWEAKKGLGTDVDSTLHGAPSWFETLTIETDRVAKFYAGLFGWTAEAMPMPDLEYTTFRLGAEYVAGMMQIRPEMGKLRPHWATYFTVRDVDQAERDAARLGATIYLPTKEAAGVGRFCGISSPQGVMFSVIQYTR